MIFSIGENGDVFLDKTNNTFSDYVSKNQSYVNYKIARSTVITYFKYRGFFKKNFIMYKRNNFDDNVIESIIKEELKKIFSNNKSILKNIDFSFINKGDTFTICFYYKMNNNVNKNLLYQTITI